MMVLNLISSPNYFRACKIYPKQGCVDVGRPRRPFQRALLLGERPSTHITHSLPRGPENHSPHKSNRPSYRGRPRRPLKFLRTRKRPQPAKKQRNRWIYENNPLRTTVNSLNLNRFRFKNLFG